LKRHCKDISIITLLDNVHLDVFTQPLLFESVFGGGKAVALQLEMLVLAISNGDAVTRVVSDDDVDNV